MDLKKKVIEALNQLQHAYIRLEDDDGISGFVVSPQFNDMSSLDRQGLIEQALSRASDPLSPAEQRRVLMIAGITPVEFDTVGSRIRVHRVKELSGGKLEVLLHGGLADAEYVRGTFKSQRGAQTSEPKQSPGARGVLMSFRVIPTDADPITKDKALRVLRSDRYIEVMPNA